MERENFCYKDQTVKRCLLNSSCLKHSCAFEFLVGISDCLQSESTFHTWPWFCRGKNERLIIFALLKIHFLDHSENSSLNLVLVCSTTLWIHTMNYIEEYSLSSPITSVCSWCFFKSSHWLMCLSIALGHLTLNRTVPNIWLFHIFYFVIFQL